MLKIPQSQAKKQNLNSSKTKSLKEILYKKIFFTNIKSTNSKEELTLFVKPKEKSLALLENFLWYGSKIATSFLIIDIDHVETPIKEYEIEVFDKLGIKPTWITRTSKGYHVGFVLKETVFLNSWYSKEKLREVKVNLTDMLNGDVAGSHRMYGFWRNPLTHKSIINLQTFDLDFLYKITAKSILVDSKNKPSNNIAPYSSKSKISLKTNQEKFIEGNRNNYLFRKTIALLYNGKIRSSEIRETLSRMNNKALPDTEILKIEKSIIKYKISHSDSNTNSNEYKKGEHNNDLWLHGIHNYRIDKGKVVNSRQKFGQMVSVTKVISNTLRKLVHGYKITYEKNEMFTNENLVENSKVSKSTIKRYRNIRKLEKDIKAKAFLLYIKEMASPSKSVKAIEPPLIELVNIAIKEMVFEYKNSNKKFYFKYNKDNRLIFYENGEELEVA